MPGAWGGWECIIKHLIINYPAFGKVALSPHRNPLETDCFSRLRNPGTMKMVFTNLTVAMTHDK
jgi:hypothetical protein